MTAPETVRVALPVPLRHLFDYLPYPGAPLPAVGSRVRVPFGRQRRVGVVIETGALSEVPAERLKPILEIIDEAPALDRELLDLLRWAADYYHHPIGEVLFASIPASLRTGASTRASCDAWQATDVGREQPETASRRAPRQWKLLRHLIDNGPANVDELDAALGSWRDAARALAVKGWVQSFRTAPPPLPVSSVCRSVHVPELSAAQRDAVVGIGAALDSFGSFVLHGVTGSGKTEVYLRLVERVLEQNRRALILVPEIALTPQLEARFRDRFGVPMVVLHSALTDHERLVAWRAAFSGEARIVLGTRSAVFAPAPDLGLIVVDEEHDASFKQHEGGFRYSARDLAVTRARRLGIPVVLGSATPALETLNNVESARYVRLCLPRRAEQAAPPRLALIDLRTSAVTAGVSTAARQAIERHLHEDGQVLVFLNRRGYAPTLLCTACGWVAPCADCDARLTVHRSTQRLKCHHCGADAPLPERCPQCGFTTKPVGQGTERLEESLASLFPGTTIVRLDRDVIRKRGDMEAAMSRMASGEARILIGTQMVTKGHDFPNVTLVVVLNADQGLFSADFRAAERLAQTIVQVAGRAGRGTRPGEVMIQTEFPEHPLLQSLRSEGYDGFARVALAERAQASWPPFSRLAALRDSARTAAEAEAFLSDARRLAEPALRPGLKVLGPVPAAMAKRAGRFHAQLLAESPDRGTLHRFLDWWLPGVEALPSARRVRWVLDIDPIEVL